MYIIKLIPLYFREENNKQSERPLWSSACNEAAKQLAGSDFSFVRPPIESDKYVVFTAV